jgi:WD40 repeat protein
MNFEEVLPVIERILESKQLNTIQQLVIEYSLAGLSYLEISKRTDYDVGYVKDTGAQLWRLLTNALGQEVTKKNIRAVLRQLLQNDAPISKELPEISENSRDWGEAVDTGTFYGRTAEIETLKQWIIDDRCRLVALLGMGGVGKTTLSVKFAEQTQTEFEFLIWRSLTQAPPFDEFVLDLVQFLSRQRDLQLPPSIEGKNARLLDYLRQHRCLLLFDNFESVLEGGGQTGHYRPGYEGYGHLLRFLGERRHQSSILLTSREKPQEIELLEGINLPVRSRSLPGLAAAEGRQIFVDKGCFGEQDEDWQEIFQHYGGNPLALKIVASAVVELFDGDIAELMPYLRQGHLGFADIKEVLASQFDRLSFPEQQAIHWLAINREPVSLKDLQADIRPKIVNQQLLTALLSLKQRSLVERRRQQWSLQPVVLEYTTTRLVEKMTEDIRERRWDLFRDYALVKAQSKDYIRQAQVSFLLEPVVDRLLLLWGDYQGIEDYFQTIIGEMRSDRPDVLGYAGGNILNSLIYLQVDLSHADFSYLPIWQAYLQDVNLYHVNFAHCHFLNSVFAQSFSGVLSIAWSRNGEIFATGNANHEVHCWRLSDRQRALTLTGHQGWVRKVALSPDGRFLASASEDRTIKLWQLSDGQCLYTLTDHTDYTHGVAFSTDGNLLVTGGCDCSIRLWDTRTGECQGILSGHTAGVLHVDISPDDRLIASSGYDNTIRIWDLQTAQCLHRISTHTNWVSTVQFSPDGQWLLSASCDCTARIWQVKTATCTGVLLGHRQWLWAACWSPDGRWIASCGEDQTIRLWDAATQTCIHTLQGHQSRVWSVAFSTDSEMVVSVSEDQTIRFWQVKSGYCIASIQGYTNWVKSVAFSANGRTVATGHWDRVLRLWDVGSGELLGSLKAHTRGITSIAFPADGQILASGGEDMTIKIWQVNSQQCSRILKGHRHEVWSLAFSPDGQILASGSYDQTIKLWDIETGQCWQTLKGHEDRVASLLFSPEGTRIVSSSDDHTIKVWDYRQGRCVRTLQGHSLRVNQIAFRPDGRLLASASLDHTVKLWDFDSFECLYTLEGHEGWVMGVVFFPDGQRIATGGCDGTIKIWQVNTGKCLHTIEAHDNWIWDLAINAEGTVIASVSEDETAKLWDTLTWTCFRTLKPRQPYEGLRFDGAIGLTPAQKTMLKVLGAIE